MKNKMFNFKLTEEEKSDLHEQAKKEGRSASNFIMWLIGEHKKRRN